MTSSTDADQALKDKHRAMWAWGDYPKVADLIAEFGPVIVEAAGITAGQRVLDVAAGAGNASLPAARAGARVVAADLTPELLAVGARRAAEESLELEWVEADAEALPFPDDDFDAVISAVGVMFVPHHQATADELIRVCRPGGTLAMINWTPEGLVGELFRTMGPYAPPPPPGVQPPPLWGNEAHVKGLLADRVTDLRFERRMVTFPPFSGPEELRAFYKTNYGPTINVYRAIADDPERTAALDHDFLALLTRTQPRGPGASAGRWQAEYLLVTARKR
jgi:2-polyprenyl-6-hydroxyphenyl methylase/3-demethylubiquinone-9 3-methyltransferase